VFDPIGNVPISDQSQAALYAFTKETPHYSSVRTLYQLAYKQVNPQPAQGMVMVPEEPTEAMLMAAEMSKPRGYRDLYKAMISASKPK